MARKSKMICGGIYEKVDANGDTQQGMLLSVEQMKDGVSEGMLLMHGVCPSPLKIAEDSDVFKELKLVGKPASPKAGRPPKATG